MLRAEAPSTYAVLGTCVQRFRTGTQSALRPHGVSIIYGYAQLDTNIYIYILGATACSYPDKQKYPALHSPLHDLSPYPAVAPNVPGGHRRVGLAVPAGQ